MIYPTISEYIDAIKAAEDNFEELKNLRPVLDEEGRPVMTSGNFAVVFKMKDLETGKYYALKCFTKEQKGRGEAYRLITEELKDVDSPYLTSIRYLDKELFVDTNQSAETEFPVLLMDWVEGKTLDKYLRENLDDKYALEMLAYRFSLLAQWLIPQPFAHGDLKPDNILIREDGSLVLVDYDGMYVPAMKGQKARELGSPDFRHPQRTEYDFDEHIDDFSLVSILLSLKAISVFPDFLESYGANDRLLLSKEDYMDIKNSSFLKNSIPSGNQEVDILFGAFLIIYYGGSLNTNNDLLHIKRPIPLVPYRLGKEGFGLYDRISNILLPLRYKQIDYIDYSLQISTSCVISNEYGGWNLFDGYTNVAIVSCSQDTNNLIWYKELKRLSKSNALFIAKDYSDRLGIIDDHSNQIIGFVFQEITTIDAENEVYLICKKNNLYGILNQDLKEVVPFILHDIEVKSLLKIVLYKRDKESTYVMDLLTLHECELPSDYGKIEDYKEGIITFEIFDGQYKFYDFERRCYINDNLYKKISQFNRMSMIKSYVLCKRNDTSILLSDSGEEYPIDFNGELCQYGETVIGITPIRFKYVNQFGFEETKIKYNISVYKKNVLESSFIYYKDYSGESFELINETTIYVSHYAKYGRLGGYINLKGEHVSRPYSNDSLRENNTQNENKHLINIVKRKYLNSTYISNFEKLDIDLYYGFIIRDLGGIAFVSYHWDNGSGNLEDYNEVDIEIGYADENMCYWSKDGMINQ